MPTTTPFNNLITFSRGSNATVTGSNGLIQWAPNNLLTFSEQFNDGAWTKAGTTISANTTAAPDGTTTADKQVEDTSTGDHRILNNIGATVTANVTYTWSVYAKAAERTSVRVTNNSLIGATFDLTDGTFSNVSGGITATSTSVGNGWYRLIITGLAATSTERIAVYLVSGGATSYTGNGASGAFIWGAQLELGSTATTYNPTTVKNLLGFSEAFDNAAWTKTGASIVTGAQANPINGLFNAQKLMENTANAQHRVTNSVTLAAAPHTLSAYLKAGERTWALMVNGTIANGFAYFNLSTGVVGSVGAGVTAASIAAVGSGWYRCAITFTAPAGSNGFEIRTASADGISIYTGDGNSGVYIYGAQLSDSASLDPYVPTPGAAPSSTAYYGPRFDYDPVTLQPRGILIEEQRTNAVTYSAQFENVAWVKNNAQIVPDIDPAAATLGPELCINGDFASGTGWTANTGWVISGGQATATATSTSMYGGQMTTVAGRVYRIDFDIVSYTSGDLLVTIGQNYDGPVRFTSPSATRRTAYVVSGTNTTRGVEFYGGAVTCAIDNVSVREVIGGALQAPDGTFTADTLLAVNTTSAGLVRSFASTAVAYTFSVYLKQGNTSFSEIEIIDQGTIANRVRLTYATGALTVVSGSPTGTATSVGNGWWRVTITYTFPAIGAADTLVVYPSTTTGTIGQYCFAWGAQLEIGAFATSYIPTIASTVTRSADVATITGQNFGQWFRQDEGCFVFEGSSFGIGSNTPNFLIASNGSAGEYVRMNGASGYTNRLLVQAGGVQSANINVGSGLVSETPAKAAGAYAVNSFQAAANAVLGVADTSGAVPAGVNQILFGSFLASAGTYLNGYIRAIRYIPVRAADFQLQALTT